MKNVNRILSMLLGVALIFGATSCKKDEPNIGGGGGDIPVADGFYLAKKGENPDANAQLVAAKVDAPSFSAMDREGFVQGYMYLTAGDYSLVEIKDKSVLNTFGGTQSTVSGSDVRNPECDANTSSYELVAAKLDGDAFKIAKDGLYVVGYDATLEEIIFDEIESVGIIGAATPGGWSADTPLTGSVTADGGEWKVEGVTIDVGEMKFRFNCRWAIDRRIDPGKDFANDNGYSMFTNYGGSFDNLQPGNEGPNINVTEYAVYTVTFSWVPGTGVSATLTKTGEATPKPDYPSELYMVGGSIGGWDWNANGVQLIPVHSNPHLFWRIVWIDPALADPGIKFAPVLDWNGDFGKTGDATNGVFAKGTENVPPPATAGYYMVVVNLEKDAETIEVNPPTIYGIGDAFGSWDAEVAANLFTVDNANKVVNSPAFTADGDLRMYVTASTLKAIGTDPAVEWWQAEFIVLSDGTIEYRGTGNDQARTGVTAGQTVSLDFIDGTGTIQ